MKKKLSYSDIAVLHLFHRKGEWLAGYSLSKASLDEGWVGPSCERRLREISNVGYHIIKGLKYLVEQRMNRGYIEYRCVGAEKPVQRVEEIIKDGLVSVNIRQEVLRL